MKKKEVELLSKVGEKGQIVIKKEIRSALRIVPGCLIRQKLVNDKILLEVVRKEEKMKRIEKIAEKIGKVWPKNVSAVEAIRRERR
jgi:bifunctional DNA-binding transcriptional regulator/antitoxin component of YhaV-PrlF toxin-antitoxin module